MADDMDVDTPATSAPAKVKAKKEDGASSKQRFEVKKVSEIDHLSRCIGRLVDYSSGFHRTCGARG
jgi:hypothetical protein